MELGVDFNELVGDVPLPLLRMIDLARALTREPQLLLLDEITAALPSDLAERVFAAMRGGPASRISSARMGSLKSASNTREPNRFESIRSSFPRSTRPMFPMHNSARRSSSTSSSRPFLRHCSMPRRNITSTRPADSSSVDRRATAV